MLGEEYVALATQRNKLNGIDAGAVGLVRRVDDLWVSIEIRGGNRNSFPKLVIARDSFGINFEPRKNSSPHRGPAAGAHFTKKYV